MPNPQPPWSAAVGTRLELSGDPWACQSLANSRLALVKPAGCFGRNVLLFRNQLHAIQQSPSDLGVQVLSNRCAVRGGLGGHDEARVRMLRRGARVVGLACTSRSQRRAGSRGRSRARAACPVGRCGRRGRCSRGGRWRLWVGVVSWGCAHKKPATGKKKDRRNRGV